MSTPTEPIQDLQPQSPAYQTDFPDAIDLKPGPVLIDTYNPRWNALTALVLWLFSVLAVFLIPSLAALPYVAIRYWGVENAVQLMSADRTVLLLTVIGVIPAHLVTFVIAWMVVTRRRSRPFWQSLGWSFTPRFGLWTSIGLALALYALGNLVAQWIGGGDTDIDILANSSLAVRLILALVATLSGPLVEEIIYRGILFPSFQRVLGMAWAVVIVSLMFTLVHVYQYRNSAGVIAVIAMLSITLTLVRAFTGRLLPCFIIHMVFNGVVSLIIIFRPYIQFFEKGVPKKGEIGTLIWHAIQIST